MASSAPAGENSGNNVPQWKRDLIQRRRQQSKVLGNGAKPGGGGVETLTAPSSSSATYSPNGSQDQQFVGCVSSVNPSLQGRKAGDVTESAAGDACNMRLEADVTLCTDSEDLLNGRPGDSESKTTGNGCRIIELAKVDTVSHRRISEECESDSSEELQYGPGIVNKLKSKYLNLTLRETNKTRPSIQCFRRAASLEDLLDCDEEPTEKARKYTKRNSNGATTKADRYRNAARGNESMKRARSVETLMRYNSMPEDQNITHRFPTIFKQEPVNDHIILIDRTTVKIESRLSDIERPKAINKPKRVKPVLADTERPPPDLVKTTMRIFEGSVKKHKPKGEVAAKVATFKTINESMKAQSQKKLVTKPPLQPKPFINGNSRGPASPKKIAVSQMPTAELIEKHSNQEECRNNGVITDSIVHSVSSVVSKFQQIGKSQSPSLSPEPSYNKVKFSPTPSPEPSNFKSKVHLDISTKSPPITPIPSPRTPKLLSPASPKKEIIRQNSTPTKSSTNSSREFLRQSSTPELPKCNVLENEIVSPSFEKASPEVKEMEQTDPPKCLSPIFDESFDEVEEIEEVDSPKLIPKSDSTGNTVQFTFKDQTNTNKSYLPGASQSVKTPPQDLPLERAVPCKTVEVQNKVVSPESPMYIIETSPSSDESVSRLHDRSLNESEETKEEVLSPQSNRPIGAISSLVRSSTTTTYPQCNETKTLKTQKSESGSPPQKQVGIIRPLVSTKTQLPQQNLSNRELEKNLINRVKSIEQPTKVTVSLKTADEIQPVKKSPSGSGGLWDTKPWNQQNNTMVFNFSNRKDVPDYIENDGLIRRKREKSKVADGGIIVFDTNLDVSASEESDWETSGGPPSPCDVTFTNDNVVINGRSNLSRTPRNHKHRIHFDDTATRTFEYPSESSMLESEGTSVDGDTSGSGEQNTTSRSASAATATSLPSLLAGGGGLASYKPSSVNLEADAFVLGITRATVSNLPTTQTVPQPDSITDTVDYLKPAQDPGAWGSETTADMLF